jgi:TonB family protein
MRSIELSRLGLLLVFSLGFGCRHSSGARPSGCPTAPLTGESPGTRYLPCQLSRAPIAFRDNADPRYPDMAASAALPGEVEVQFVIDSAGHYERGSMRVVRSTHETFTASARYTLSTWRFTPGILNDRPVRVQLAQVIEYVLPPASDPRELFAGEPAIVTRRKAPDGTPMLTVMLAAEDTTLGPPPSPTLRDSLARAAIRVVAHKLTMDFSAGRQKAGATLPLCVGSDDAELQSAVDANLIRELTTVRVRAMPLKDCPPTRASMAVLVPDPGPPPARDSVPFVEPHRVVVRSARVRRTGGPRVDVVDESGMSEYYIRCIRASSTAPIATLRCLTTAIGGH